MAEYISPTDHKLQRLVERINEADANRRTWKQIALHKNHPRQVRAVAEQQYTHWRAELERLRRQLEKEYET